jgi:hypothetical protein
MCRSGAAMAAMVGVRLDVRSSAVEWSEGLLQQCDQSKHLTDSSAGPRQRPQLAARLQMLSDLFGRLLSLPGLSTAPKISTTNGLTRISTFYSIVNES